MHYFSPASVIIGHKTYFPHKNIPHSLLSNTVIPPSVLPYSQLPSDDNLISALPSSMLPLSAFHDCVLLNSNLQDHNRDLPNNSCSTLPYRDLPNSVLTNRNRTLKISALPNRNRDL